MNKIEKTIDQYFKGKSDIVAVFLFGSHAANHARHFSDVDIGIVAERGAADRVKRAFKRYSLDLSRETRKDIHMVMLNQAPERLLSQVLGKGCCLTVNDRRQLVEFKMYKIVKIADFSFHKKQMQAGFAAHLKGV